MENINYNSISKDTAKKATQREALSEIQIRRIEKWKKKKEKETAPITYTQQQTDVNKTEMRAECKYSNLTDQQIYDLHQATLCAITGSSSLDYAGLFLSQTASAFFCNDDRALTMNALNSALLAMEPQDIIESQLCSKILILHNQATIYMAMATNPEQDMKKIEIHINRATKLMRLHNETVEALSKYRRKGEQKVTVQRVNVNDGGKAIVTGEFKQGVGE